MTETRLVESYLDDLRREIRTLPGKQRKDILDDVGNQLRDAIETAHAETEGAIRVVLARMGTPRHLAVELRVRLEESGEVDGPTLAAWQQVPKRIVAAFLVINGMVILALGVYLIVHGLFSGAGNSFAARVGIGVLIKGLPMVAFGLLTWRTSTQWLFFADVVAVAVASTSLFGGIIYLFQSRILVGTGLIETLNGAVGLGLLLWMVVAYAKVHRHRALPRIS